MSKTDPGIIRARIIEVACRVPNLPPAVADEVAFHMTDWLDNLDAYARFCADPRAMSDEEVDSILESFLVHVPNHVAAAGMLYTGVSVTDVFEVGAITEQE